LTVTPFGERYLTALDRGYPADDNHHLSDSVVLLREKLMHGLPVRVVAVTNIDLKIMSRRTPTDSVVRVEEVTDLVAAVTGFFDRLSSRLMTSERWWPTEQ